MKSGSGSELVWTMVSRAKTIVLVILVLISIQTSLFITDVEPRDSPMRARIAQGVYTISLNVTVTDEVGRPMREAFVWILGNASSPWQVGPDGSIIISGLADTGMNYTVWANKTGYLNSINTEVNATPDQTTNVTLEIYGGTIHGIVSSPTGPLSDATVSVTIPPGDEYSADVSATNGFYSLEGIPTGSYDVTASAEGYSDNESLAVIVTAGKTTNLNLTIYSLSGQIYGFVYLSTLDNRSFSEVNISAILGDAAGYAIIGDDGNYTISNLAEGNYSVSATMEGYLPYTQTGIAVRKGYATWLNFSLSEMPARIFGTVKSGTFLQPDVNVSLFGTANFNITNVEGDYSIENLTSGLQYTITAQLEGYALATIPDVYLPIGGQIRIDIELVALPGAIVRGEVLGKDSGAPLMFASVTIITRDGEERFKYTNSKGQFEFTGLEEGTYTLQFTMEGYKPLEVTKIEVTVDTVSNETYYLEPQRKGFEGFIFGFDLAHSMMILALFITILILAVAVYLRYRSFQTPETAPAVYDQEEEVAEKKDETGTDVPVKTLDEKDET